MLLNCCSIVVPMWMRKPKRQAKQRWHWPRVVDSSNILYSIFYMFRIAETLSNYLYDVVVTWIWAQIHRWWKQLRRDISIRLNFLFKKRWIKMIYRFEFWYIVSLTSHFLWRSMQLQRRTIQHWHMQPKMDTLKCVQHFLMLAPILYVNLIFQRVDYHL